MKKKAESGGLGYRAPVGYKNVRESTVGRSVSYVVPDSERADLVKLAFELYATGEYTLESLAAEMTAHGLTTRGRRDAPPKPLSLNSLSWLLSNGFYLGKVEFAGVEYKGIHEPLVDSKPFTKVQDLLAARTTRGTREMRHRHYLKGTLALCCLWPAAFAAALEGQVRLLLLPWAERPAPAHRLPRGIHPGRWVGTPG